MSHLALRLNGKYLAVNPDTEIDLTDTNPYFNEQSETLSQSFTLPLAGNREVFGDVDCIESRENLRSIEQQRMDIEVDGLPFRSGKVDSVPDQEINDSVQLQMVSALYSLEQYLDGVRCRDVELIDKIKIGETIGNLKLTYSYDLYLHIDVYPVSFTWLDGEVFKIDQSNPLGENIHTEFSSIKFPALGFSTPAECNITNYFNYHSDGDADNNKEPTITQSYINVTNRYGEENAKYCNMRIAYPHKKKDSDGASSDEIYLTPKDDDNGRFNPYLVLDANRPASGICFYVLYFLDCLFARLRKDNVAYDNSQLLKVDDLRRLAFVTTQCKFDTVSQRNENNNPTPMLQQIENINSWLKTRNIHTKLKLKQDKEQRTVNVETVTINGDEYTVGKKTPKKYFIQTEENSGYWAPAIVRSIYYCSSLRASILSADVMDMYANSQNFPDADAKTIIDSLWASFGIRFYLDQETHTVTPRFIRDIFRDNSRPLKFPCRVIKATKQLRKCTGFRMQYSGQSDKQQRKDNITLGTTDYDTTYDYEDYRNLDISLQYSEIINNVYDTNNSLYCDLHTGNLYRVKIDGEAETRKDYHPSLFEVGQLHGIEIGDCSDENEDYVKTLTSNFQPVVFNDVNFYYERLTHADDYQMTSADGSLVSVSFDTEASQKQILAAFVSEEMQHENIERKIIYPMGDRFSQFDIECTIKTFESYDVASSSDGDSPLQSADWGLGIAIMRGGGADAKVQDYDYNYDGFGNCKYRMLAGTDYTLSLDSIDCYATRYDYNGELEGDGSEGNVGDDGRISLKIRTFIPAPYDITYDGKTFRQGEPLCDAQVARRGLFDRFMSEYATFCTEATPILLDIECEAAALLHIAWHRRYSFGDYVGWINKIKTKINASQGIASVQVELMVL